jgi:hypothetical protein
VTFRVRVRGAAGLLSAEYRCEQHGRFDCTVERDGAGDPPGTQPCPSCGAAAAWTISAPGFRRQLAVAAVKGRADDRPSPYHQDFSRVADGNQTMGEWQAERDKLWDDHRRAEIQRNT